ncbi:hypothetical protein VTP01DRAFT_4429 [Rhizomucor pusillus]|uniref:uncharacterized protein n=1 Tax=Rhizomucor pusillus TaxID=4840 RepID=UPI003742BA67
MRFVSAALAILFAASPAFAATCTVSTSGDAAEAIESAFKQCASGGTVVFTKGATYNMKSVVSVTDVKNVKVQFEGTVNLPAYNEDFEDEKAFFYIEGDNITWKGSGVFNGNGQGWYNAQNRNAPPLFKPKVSNSYFGGFSIKNAPRSHFSVNGCENVVFEHLTLNTVSSNSKYPAKNTDAFDVSDSTGIVIQSSSITNGDDCIAVNHGAQNLTVTNLDCTGSHGFSVGSLGKKGNTESVSDLKFISNACHDCQNGVRIKTWPGGKGSVTGVTFDDIYLDNVENPIIVTTHYCDNQQMSYCNGADSSSLSIHDVTINNIYGTEADNVKHPVLSINCSTDTPCYDFKVTNVNITPGDKATDNVCENLKEASSISYCK